MTPDTSATQIEMQAPFVVLPVGICTSAKPRVEWRGVRKQNAFEVRITDGTSTTSTEIWNSGQVSSEKPFYIVPSPLPASATLHCHVRVKEDGSWSAWSSDRVSAPFRVEPVIPIKGTLVTYDLQFTRKLSPSLAFQHAHAVAILQGIVNRISPRLYINFIQAETAQLGFHSIPDGDVDLFWLRRLREKEGWLSEMDLLPCEGIGALVEHFRNEIKGVVLWDPKVDATAIVASTVAGCDDLLPIPLSRDSESLYHHLVETGPKLPVKVDLTGRFTGSGNIWESVRKSTGSAKCDAHLWAVEKYLKTGKCDPTRMGYYMDAYWIRNPGAGGNWQNHTLTNHDYFVSKRAFFWDLNVWADEATVDDPGQSYGTDLSTLKEILQAANDQTSGSEIIHVGGFTPWAFKYTDHVNAGGRHGGVPTEWETARVLSAYNAYVDADALGLGGMANASVLTHMSLPARYVQPAALTPVELRSKGLLNPNGTIAQRNYFMHYVGDYDAASWVWSVLTFIWEGSRRPDVPMCWAVNPNLLERAAPFFEHAMRTRTASDHFMAGDSGAGYVNPTQLLPPREPSSQPAADKIWQQHCQKFYSRFGITATGFLINGNAGKMTSGGEEMYLPFSTHGIVNQHDPKNAQLHLVKTRMPAFMMQWDLSGDAEQDAILVHERAKPDSTDFLVFRTILKPISYFGKLNTLLNAQRPDMKYEFCDPVTFAFLARCHLGGDNENFATYLFDSIPVSAAAGTTLAVEIAVRNDGWDAWSADAGQELDIGVTNDRKVKPASFQSYPITRSVVTADSVVIHVNLQVPAEAGQWFVYYEMVRNGIAFSSGGVAPAIVALQVTR